MTLSIPTQRDPLARLALLALVAGVIYALVASAGVAPVPAQAQGIIILEDTATPALPQFTPVPEAPALGFALATPTPAPGWLDQRLADASDAGDQFAADQAAQLAAEQAQYLANVGAQTPHSPRGDVQALPAYTSGPVAYPAENIIIDPNPAPVAPQMAVAAPMISDAQAAIIGARQSNGCATGEVFYPRTGCHMPGSGGPMPGPVGAP